VLFNTLMLLGSKLKDSLLQLLMESCVTLIETQEIKFQIVLLEIPRENGSYLITMVSL